MEGTPGEYALRDILKVQLIKEYLPPAGYNPLEAPEIKELLSSPPKTSDYPDGAYLTRLAETVIDVEKDKSYKVTTRKIRYALKEKGKEYAGNAKIFYFPEFQKADIEYALSVLDKKTNHLNDVSVQTGSEFSSWPEYNVLRSRKFSVPNIKVNSVIEFKYSLKSRDNPLMPFYETSFFRNFEPVSRTVLRVNVPENLVLRYKESNLGEKFSFKKNLQNGIASYIWEAENLAPYSSENQMPPYALFAPQVSLSLGESWAETAATFKKELEGRISVSPGIKKQVEELVKGKNTDLEKAEAVFNWVAAAVTLAPVPMNYVSFAPKASDRIFELKSGNFLDKPFLLYVMLREAGLKPSFAYVADKTSALFQEELPNVSQFSAAQVVIEAAGKKLVLIPLDDKQRYNQVPPEYQGAWALEVLGPGPGSVYRNPELSSAEEATLKEETVKMNASGGIEGTIVLKPYGNGQRDWRSLKDSKEKEIKNYFERYAHGIHPNARLEKYGIENLNDINADLSVKIGYRVPDYALNLSDKYLIFKFPDIKFSAHNVGQEKRELPVFFMRKDKNSRVTELRLPPGYVLYYAPPKTELKFLGNLYSAEYSVKGEKLILKEELSMEETLIKPEDYPGHKSFMEKVAAFTDNWLVLKKK